MSDTINITTTIVEETVEIITTDNQTIVNVINQSGGTNITKTSDITNDGSDGTSTYVETDQLGAVAFSNNYNDLENKPTIPAAQIQSDWNQTNDSALDFIKNKPTIPIVETPTLSQVLTQGGRALDEVIFADYTIQPSDRSKFREISNSGTITITIDDTTWTPDDKTEGGTFIFKNANDIDGSSKVILARNPSTVWNVSGLGSELTEIEIPCGYIVEITQGVLGFSVVLHSARVDSYFEVQITQTGTDAPDIVSGSIIGAMGASISTTYNSVGDYYIVADLPIFANVKDYIKNGGWQKIDFITVAAGLNTYGVTVMYIDDYTIKINTYNYTDFFSVYLSNNAIPEPFLIQIPFKP